MANSYDVVVIGAGAAGVAAGQRLAQANASFVILEARARLGGRCWTVQAGGYGVDLGAGWLHAAERNLWRAEAERIGFALDRSPAPWERRAARPPTADEAAFRAAYGRFNARIETADSQPDRPAADYLEPGDPHNDRISATAAFLNGATLEHISAHDYIRYDGAGGNQRLSAGYGALIEALGAPLPVSRETIARLVDHGGKTIRVETNKGTLDARAVIVTAPTPLLAEGTLRFAPTLPAQIDAAAGLKLGTVDKLFIGFAEADMPPGEGRVFVSKDAGVSYDLRPMNRPMIEMFAAGPPAEALEREGAAGMFAFAMDEIAGQVGASVRAKLRPLAVSLWGQDEFARGSYSYAAPGKAGARDFLAAPALERIFFAGEAVAGGYFGTAHGAGETGIAAAAHALAALRRR